jgi:hypothetical protein
VIKLNNKFLQMNPICALNDDTTNHEMCIQFHGLPFCFILPGNGNAALGQHYIHIDYSFAFQSLQFSVFQKQMFTVISPEDLTVGSLYICMSINTCHSIFIYVSITLGPKGNIIVSLL